MPSLYHGVHKTLIKSTVEEVSGSDNKWIELCYQLETETRTQSNRTLLGQTLASRPFVRGLNLLLFAKDCGALSHLQTNENEEWRVLKC